ncbi:MAG: hypothetical protein ACLR4Z_01795 [Butyricicoccaceae bacterium]
MHADPRHDEIVGFVTRGYGVPSIVVDDCQPTSTCTRREYPDPLGARSGGTRIAARAADSPQTALLDRPSRSPPRNRIGALSDAMLAFATGVDQRARYVRAIRKRRLRRRSPSFWWIVTSVHQLHRTSPRRCALGQRRGGRNDNQSTTSRSFTVLKRHGAVAVRVLADATDCRKQDG